MFMYKVKYWCPDAKRELTETGLVGASKWGKACKEICEVYDEEYVHSIELTPYDDVMYAEAIIEELEDELSKE